MVDVIYATKNQIDMLNVRCSCQLLRMFENEDDASGTAIPPGSATRVAGRLNSSVRALELLMRRTKGHTFKV